MADIQDTIAAIATPPGRGGIGIIRISGPGSLNIARSLTGKQPSPGRFSFSVFKDQSGHVLDQGVLLYFKKPASYTGEDVVELHGHGGRVVLEMLLKQVIAHGARYARPGEFTERAYLNDKLDLLQAEAVADLIDSASEQAVRSAVRSLEGEFSSAVDRLLQAVIKLRAYVEGALDFPEEEIYFMANPELNKQLQSITVLLDNILQKANRGRLLNEGIRAAIIGRPNAGKSSLLNQLLKTDRAIVAPEPGTTRDVIDENILIDGVLLNVVDTAGVREGAERVEQEGVRRTMQEVERADIVLLVVEADESAEQEAAQLLNEIGADRKTVIIHNKIDLAGKGAAVINTKDQPASIYLSARTGEGIEMLEQLLKALLLEESAEEDVILARARHLQALKQARQSLMKSRDALQAGAAEIMAEELNRTQKALAEVTGEFSADDLLGEIFSRFCIGK